MKAQHRHELETNWLAQRVSEWLDRVQPYNSLILGAIVAIAVGLFGFSYYTGSSTARQSEAWNTYNQAVEGLMPNLETLRESAQDYPDSPMQQYADVTWADGQVWMAARAFLQNRSAALEALSRAESTYQGLLQESDDPQMLGRAHFGLGRIYELRNELDKAKEQYTLVTGAFAKLAEQRAKDLTETETKETYDWLATAQAPRRTAPEGPGTPGERPDFAPGELDIPTGESSAAPSIDDLFKGIGETPEQEESERYELGEDEKTGTDAGESAASAGDASKSEK